MKALLLLFAASLFAAEPPKPPVKPEPPAASADDTKADKAEIAALRKYIADLQSWEGKVVAMLQAESQSCLGQPPAVPAPASK